ncbi:MAG: hypothetical protein RR189_02805 [Bacilli bacterium]
MKRKLLFTVIAPLAMITSCTGYTSSTTSSSSNISSSSTSTTTSTSSESSSTTSITTPISIPSSFVSIGDHDPNKIEPITYEEALAIAFTRINETESFNYINTIQEESTASAIQGVYAYKFIQQIDDTPGEYYMYSYIKETYAFILDKKLIDLVNKIDNQYQYLSSNPNATNTGNKTEEETKTLIANSKQNAFKALFIRTFLLNNAYVSNLNFYVTGASSIIFEVASEISYETYLLETGRFTFNDYGLLTSLAGTGMYQNSEVSAKGNITYNSPIKNKKTTLE